MLNTIIILQIMRTINNFFASTKIESKLEIIGKTLELPSSDFIAGQYVAITGSVLNNGVYLLEDDLKIYNLKKDENFIGVVYGLTPPQDFLKLVAEIEEFQNSDDAKKRIILSERFENYSWNAKTDSSGNIPNWQTLFKKELNSFRKMFCEVHI